MKCVIDRMGERRFVGRGYTIGCGLLRKIQPDDKKRVLHVSVLFSVS